MTYPLKFREKVLNVQREEGLTFLETAKRFQIGTDTLVRWHRKIEPVAVRTRQPRKINPEKLQEDVRLYPDAYLSERAERFGVSVMGIWHALRRLEITRKKKL